MQNYYLDSYEGIQFCNNQNSRDIADLLVIETGLS